MSARPETAANRISAPPMPEDVTDLTLLEDVREAEKIGIMVTLSMADWKEIAELERADLPSTP